MDQHKKKNKIRVSYKILHDGNTLAQDVANVFEYFGDVELFNEYQYPNVHGEHDQWVVVASMRERNWLYEVQSQAKLNSLPVLVIGLEPGFIWFGPRVSPNDAGCFECLAHWANNNSGEEYHWSILTDEQDNRRDLLPATMPVPQVNIFAALLSQYIELCLSETSESFSRLVIRLDITNSRTERHRFIPVHDCSICSSLANNSSELADGIKLLPRYKSKSTDSRVINTKLDLEKLKEEFLDRHVGLIKHVFYSLTSNLMPMFSSELPISGTTEVESGYGRSETRKESELIAVLEALERYCGHSPKGQRTTVRGSYKQLSEHALDPRKLILHDDALLQKEHFVLHPYTDDLEFNWVWCKSLVNDSPILIPEQSIFYYLLHTRESTVNRFIYETSNGCALGGAMEEAIFYGLLELVERDAYLTTWYGKFTPKEIDISSIDDDRIQSLLRLADRRGFTLHAFDMRVGIDIPAVWCMIVDNADDAPVKCYCAAGAHLSPEKAIYSGLIEVMTSMGVYQESMPPLKEKAIEMLLDDDKVLEMHDHVVLYSQPEAYSRLDFLFSDSKKLTLQEIYGSNYTKENLNLTDDLIELMDKVSLFCDDVIVADLTIDQLRKHQLYCVKVIAPGLMPVTFGHQYRRISLERINKFASQSGKEPFRNLQELNQFPHNFP